MIDYQKILTDLHPFMDKIALCPALDEEIETLQNYYDKKLPNYFIEYLKVFGLKQDFILELFNRVDKYENAMDYNSSDDYFGIGDEWHEEHLMLKFDETHQNLYKYQYEGSYEIIKIGTFEELIYKNISRIKTSYENLIPNSQKVFQAYYDIGTSNDTFLIKQLSKHIDTELIKPLAHVDTNLIGTKKYEGLIRIEGYLLKLIKEGRSDISLQWENSVEKIINNTFFLKLEAALDNCVFSYYPSTFWVARW